MSGINWNRNKMRQRMARQGSEVAIDKADLLKASRDDLRKMANRLLAVGNAPKAKMLPIGNEKVPAARKRVSHFRGKKGGNRTNWSGQQFVDRSLPAGLVIYADGCCEPNPGPGGWGYVAYLDGKEIHNEMGGCTATTNNVMELTGALMALRWLAGRADRVGARLLCDSQYVVNGCNDWRHGWKKKGWRRGEGALANADLWKELDAALTAMPLRLEWCKGHAGIIGNERADELSLIGRESVVEQALASDMVRQQLQYTI